MSHGFSSSEPGTGGWRRRDLSARLASPAGPAAEDGKLRTRRALLGFAVALVATIGVAAILSGYELFVLRVKPWAERHPEWSPYYIARSGVALACSGLLLLGIERGAVAGAMLSNRLRLTSAQRGVMVALCLIGFGSAGLLVYDPALFSVLGSEDQVVEWLSAGLLFAAAGCLFYAFVRAGPKQRTQAAISGLFAAAFLLIALEEVSWFQRVFDLKTPAGLLAANQQEELNLHNLHSNLAELLYYGGAFCLLLLLPYFCLITGGDLAPGIPPAALGVFLIGASAPLAGHNYDMWNIFPIQISFFATCLMLARLGASAAHSSQLHLAATLGLALVSLVVTQSVFLTFGAGLIRLWDVTEYKELFIASGCFCLAVGVLRSGPAR
jgi:hypothetical protein